MAIGFMRCLRLFPLRDCKWLACALLAFPGLLCAAEVSLIGVFPGKGAVLVIDGGPPKSVMIGQQVGEVTLISVDKTGAVVEEARRRRTLSLGQHVRGAPAASARAPQVTLALDGRGHFAEMVEKLEAQEGHIEMTFAYFIDKSAPVSGVRSLMDYEVTFTGEIRQGKPVFSMKVLVPVTSLCPCSKEISDYGAHNQRSHVTVTATTNDFVWIEEIVAVVEKQASCELYGLLKRPDEKHVTERAYDNPKFVEDMVRDVAAVLNADDRIDAYVVESENFESIHNHSAYALIERDKSAA